MVAAAAGAGLAPAQRPPEVAAAAEALGMTERSALRLLLFRRAQHSRPEGLNHIISKS